MSPLFRFVTLTFASFATLPAWSAPGPEDVARVLEGVPAFSLTGFVPGVLRLEPAQARPLLLDSERRVFGALGSSSGGRVVAFSHDAFLRAECLKAEPGLLRLAVNSIRWAGQAETPAVGVDPGLQALEPLLRAQGFNVQRIVPSELARQVDVYCLVGDRAIPIEGMDHLRRFLLKGGGVFTVATPGTLAGAFSDFHQLPANQIALLAGIEFLAEGTSRIHGRVLAVP